jgi:hypothetical protein
MRELNSSPLAPCTQAGTAHWRPRVPYFCPHGAGGGGTGPDNEARVLDALATLPDNAVQDRI